MIHFKKENMKAHEAIPGYFGRFVHGDDITVVHWEIKKGNVVPEHQHDHEQFVNCLEGEFIMNVDGKEYPMGPGDTVIIPSNSVHSAYAVTDARCLDVFTPRREDYVFD
jgi:quercetin dioxygenase-like cupin family protein